MRTRVKKFMYMAMLVALTLAFPSCNVEMELGNNTLEYRERTAYLCSYDWQDDWYDDYGLHHFQVLRFYTNGTGEDFIRIQGWNLMGDFFAVSLVFFAVSGLFMVKGKNGLDRKSVV